MSQNDTIQHPDPRFARVVAIIGLIACFVFVAGDIVGGIVVNDYDPIAETISDLAAGQRSWILDTAISIFASSLLLSAVMLYRWQLDENELRWNIGCVVFLLLGLDILLIANHDAYGDAVPTGVEIHIYLVYFLGFAFALVAWLFANGFGKISKFWSRLSKGIGLVWLILAPIFFVVPTAWNGAYERFLGIIFLTWVASIYVFVLRHLR